MAAEKTLVRTTARHAPSGLEVAGYEIHHGQTTSTARAAAVDAAPTARSWASPATTAASGARTCTACSMPTPFRRWFIDRLRVRRGLPPVGEVVGRYDIEPALDRLAEVVRASLRMDEIYRLMGLR